MAEDHFLQPWTAGPSNDYTENQNFQLGSTIQLAWSTTFEKNPVLQLRQDSHPEDGVGVPVVVLDDSVDGSAYTWTVAYHGMNPSLTNVFYFFMQDQSANTLTSSHYFNISGEETSSSATTTTQGSTSTTRESNTVAGQTETTAVATIGYAPTVTVTQTAAASNGNGNGSGISAGTVAGIAIGVVAGIFILVGVVWWAWKARRRTGKEGTGSQGLPQQALSLDPHSVHEVHACQGPRLYEVDGTSAGMSPQQAYGK
ncbi:hypothetical protein F4778DRAFT_356942 [Xylariomycetidae sp. FL2044]|nr:hypothetical protein F4778DRAFT_356942 [Xylariomycetidae sp. FL2044]